MARYGRIDSCKVAPDDYVLDVLYINDYAPGAAMRAESGIWTVNPVNWVTYPCREAVPEPGYSDNGGAGYGLCVGQPILVVPTTGDTSFALLLENNGLTLSTVFREDSDYYYLDLKNSDGSSVGAFAIQKLVGEIYLTDWEDIPLSSLRTLEHIPGDTVEKKN